MESMDAFEQQLSRMLTQVAGPDRPVDAMAVVRSAKSAPEGEWSVITRWFRDGTATPTGGGFSMSSALEFMVAGVIVALFGGFLLAVIPMTQQGDILPAAMTEPSAPPRSTVEVRIEGLEGAAGSRLVAILYEGVSMLNEGGQGPPHGLGAFSTDITSDPFDVTDTIREGSAWWDSTTDDPVIEVPPGTHSLVIWVSSDLGPYGQWLPGEPIEAACAVPLTVSEGESVKIVIVDIPWGEINADCVTQSPTEAFLSGMLTEEVEPGVYRVINDGVHDLEDLALYMAETWDGLGPNEVVAGSDGSIWVFMPDWFFRVGERESDRAAPPWLPFSDADIEVGPDGHVWLVTERVDGTADLITFEDDPEAALRWGDPTDPQLRDTGEREYLGVEIATDGTVYSAWLDAPSFVPDRRTVNVGMYSGRAWLPLPELTPGGSIFVSDIELGKPGTGLWLSDGEALYRLEGSDREWSIVDVPVDVDGLDVGPDGTVWIQAMEHADGDPCGLRLARFDGTEWETWGRDDGVPAVGPVFFYGGCNGGVRAAAPDGSIWLAAWDSLIGRECSGIARFDGTAWTRYLKGRCVYDAAVAPDGAVWLQAGEVSYEKPAGDDPSLAEAAPEFGPIHLFVITPEAVAEEE